VVGVAILDFDQAASSSRMAFAYQLGPDAESGGQLPEGVDGGFLPMRSKRTLWTSWQYGGLDAGTASGDSAIG